MRIKYCRRVEGTQWLPGFQEYEQIERVDNPQDDNDLYINAQADYVTTKSKKAWAEMFNILRNLTGKALTIELKKTGYRMDKETFSDIVCDAVMFVLERYKYSGYLITKVVTQARLAVRFVLYKDKLSEQIESLAVKIMNSKSVSPAQAFIEARDALTKAENKKDTRGLQLELWNTERHMDT